MHNRQRARYLAKFLAPVLANAGDLAAESGSPHSCSCHEKVAGPAEPAVDTAVLLELREVRKKVPRRSPGELAADELSDRLTEVLESDDHAVGVLWALLAGRDNQPRADALPETLAGSSGGGGLNAPGGRKASRGGNRPPCRVRRPLACGVSGPMCA
jgi:hypothetical protein